MHIYKIILGILIVVLIGNHFLKVDDIDKDKPDRPFNYPGKHDRFSNKYSHEDYQVRDGAARVNIETVEQFFNHPRVKSYYNSEDYKEPPQEKCLSSEGLEWVPLYICVTPIEKELMNLCNNLSGEWNIPAKDESPEKNCTIDLDSFIYVLRQHEKDKKEENSAPKEIGSMFPSQSSFEYIYEKEQELYPQIIKILEEEKLHEHSDVNNEKLKQIAIRIMQENDINSINTIDIMELAIYIFLSTKIKALAKNYKNSMVGIKCENNDIIEECSTDIRRKYIDIPNSKQWCDESFNEKWIPLEDHIKSFKPYLIEPSIDRTGYCLHPEIPTIGEIELICENDFNGIWERVGFAGTPRCNFYYQDAGKKCKLDSDCMSDICLALEKTNSHGRCKPDRVFHAPCYTSFETGDNGDCSASD